VDDRQAEPVEGRDEGQEHRIGVRRHDAHGDVGGHDEPGEPTAVAHDVGRDRALDAQPDCRVGADADHERQQEQEELSATATSVHEPHQGAVLTHPGTSWRAA
jgi:hypothetical protein